MCTGNRMQMALNQEQFLLSKYNDVHINTAAASSISLVSCRR